MLWWTTLGKVDRVGAASSSFSERKRGIVAITALRETDHHGQRNPHGGPPADPHALLRRRGPRPGRRAAPGAVRGPRRCAGFRSAHGEARADGPGRLSGRAGRPSRRRGCPPGDLPRDDPQGRRDPGPGRPGLLAAPGCVPRGPARQSRGLATTRCGAPGRDVSAGNRPRQPGDVARRGRPPARAAPSPGRALLSRGEDARAGRRRAAVGRGDRPPPPGRGPRAFAVAALAARHGGLGRDDRLDDDARGVRGDPRGMGRRDDPRRDGHSRREGGWPGRGCARERCRRQDAPGAIEGGDRLGHQHGRRRLGLGRDWQDRPRRRAGPSPGDARPREEDAPPGRPEEVDRSGPGGRRATRESPGRASRQAQGPPGDRVQGPGRRPRRPAVRGREAVRPRRLAQTRRPRPDSQGDERDRRPVPVHRTRTGRQGRVELPCRRRG
jgi:hypothetical protein